MLKKILITASLFVLPLVAWAEVDVEAFKSSLKEDLLAVGVEESLADQAIAQIKPPQKKIIKKLNNQPESKMTFAEYSSRLVSDWRVRKGISNFQENSDDLQSSSAKYGVPPQVITALWGIETGYGSVKPDYDMVPALATLAMSSHRKKFFRNELIKSVQIVSDGHIPLSELKGSWAGAMGQCQFMPSSFMTFAKDGDGDGRIDIWNTKSDVFDSAGNYLAKSGWESHQKWGERVILGKILPQDITFSERGLSDRKPLSEWKNIGLYAQKGKFQGLESSIKARLFIPDGPSGKAYLVYPNFDVILKWNRSSYFAYAVLTLADKIHQGVNG